MSMRTIVVVLLAVACGISAAWGMSQFRNTAIVRVQAGTAPVAATIPVVVAKVDIPRSQMATEENVTLQQRPEAIVPEGALTRLEDAFDRPAIFPVLAGEALFDAKLASKDGGRGLAISIPKGMRAHTIRAVGHPANVAGFILPGNRVDVHVTLKGKPDDETGGGSTRTLLQSVEILAVDQQLDAPLENKTDPAGLKSVTLLVTLEQANRLDLGQLMGKLTLSLRNPLDEGKAKNHPATLANLRFGQMPASFRILTLRGSRRGFILVSAGQ